MDFIKKISSIQVDKDISDAEMAKLTGINEYTYYNLKKYRVYLSKVSYFAISGVLGLPLENDAEIERILNENKGLVGLPESNLSIAAECVNPDYLEKLEKELARLKKTADTLDDKNQVIKSQFLELDKLKRDLESNWNDVNKRIQEAYTDGVREGASKVQNMKEAQNQSMLNLLNEEYTDKINKLENALKKVKEQYLKLYEVVNAFNNKVGEEVIKLSCFEKPINLKALGLEDK